MDITWGRSYHPLATGYIVWAKTTQVTSGQDQQHETAQQEKAIDDLQATFIDLFPGRLYIVSLRVISGMGEEEEEDEVVTYLEQYTSKLRLLSRL